jgi:HK97 gp10 family phage protein
VKFTMTVHGGADLSRRLDAMPAAVSRKVLLAALTAGGMPIRDRAAQLAPREPGKPDLADNINIAAVRRKKDQAPTVAIGPSKQFFYDYFQEYGTVRHRAQPFYRPAFDSESVRSLGIIGQQLWAAIKGSARVSQGSSEPIRLPRTPRVTGGPSGGLL